MTRFKLSCLPLNTSSFVPLHFFRAKVYCSPQALEGSKKALEHAYYISHGYFLRFVRGKIFLRLEMPWVNFFWRPYLCKI
jgi:hypothetical protein